MFVSLIKAVTATELRIMTAARGVDQVWRPLPHYPITGHLGAPHPLNMAILSSLQIAEAPCLLCNDGNVMSVMKLVFGHRSWNIEQYHIQTECFHSIVIILICPFCHNYNIVCDKTHRVCVLMEPEL